MDEAWSRTQNRVHPTHGETSTSCIMRIQRSVRHTHTCMCGVWAELWGPAKRKRDRCGRQGRTNPSSLSLGPSRRPPPDRNSPAKPWEKRKHTKPRPQRRHPARRCIIITFYSYSGKPAPLKVLPSPAIHPTTDHRSSPHKDLIISRDPPSRVTYTTAGISWYSGAGACLLDPANQLLGGRVSPRMGIEAPAPKGRPPAAETRRLFFLMSFCLLPP